MPSLIGSIFLLKSARQRVSTGFKWPSLYPFIAIVPRSTLAPDRVLSMSQIELNCVIMLN